MPDLCHPHPSPNPYHWCVTKRAKKEPDPDDAYPLSREDAVFRAINALAGESEPIMVTGWMCIAEYMQADGSVQLGAFCSDMPPWRMSGLMEAGYDMLYAQYDFFEED